ncbi:MAG TPA: serine hydrolase [Desulfosporosinus sp.]|nr:serine hydrolase [Desulfosporosinus sp.]
MKRITFILLILIILIISASGCRAANDIAGPSGASVPENELVENTPDTAAVPAIEEEWPDYNWQFDTPENHGVDGALLKSLHDAIQDINIYSVVIAKDGYIIDEYYKQGYDERSVFPLNSCTKSFTSALIGMAIDQGLLDGVDTKLSEFFPQLADSDSASKKEITIAHLLEHTSGIYWPESGGPMFRNFVQSENWVDFVLSQPMATKPGTAFNYSTGGSHLLSAIIQQAAGQTSYDFALEHLLQPLGMDSVQWRTDPQGITDGGNGISMNARDAAKFGQLYLDGGRWNDRQILPEAWVAESTKPQSAAQPIPGYGYQWWLRTFGNLKTYFAVGHAGQYIVVVPDLELVAVSTGYFPSGSYPFLNYFRDYVLAACGY